MGTPVTSSTFLSQYNDDFTDSDHYHRILFNNGRALQARELTQMQTIIQAELARLAGFVFTEGGMFSTSPGSLLAGRNAVSFVKVDSLPTGYAKLVGSEISNAAGVKAIIKAVVPAVNGDNNTLLVVYTAGNNQSSSNTNATPRIFLAGETLNHDADGLDAGTFNVQSTDTSVNPATGKGSFIEVPQFNTFVAGHLILVEKQSLVISKYDPNPTDTIGFVLKQEVISATDDIALYDNSGSTPNLTSPGADRYKITLTLKKGSEADSDETFYQVYDIVRGIARNIRNQDNLLGELGAILNNRTNDISGNFIVQKTPFGKFNLEIQDDSDDNYLLYKVNGGIAFVAGNRIERSEQTTLRIKKPRDLTQDRETVATEFAAARYGNYFIATTIKGLVNEIDTLGQVNMYAAINRGGGTVGTCRIRHIDEFDGTFRIHVFDLSFNSGKSIGDVLSIGDAADNYANIDKINDVIDLQDRAENSLLFPLPGVRVDTVQSISCNIGKLYTATSNASGNATFSTGNSNIFADMEQAIIETDSSGNLESSPSTTGTINSSVEVTGQPTSSALTMLGYEAATLTRKTKTLRTARVQSGLSLSNRKITLDRADVYKITSIVDDTTSEDITYRFVGDNGQRPDYYTVGSAKLRHGQASPSGTVTVTYDFFEHSAGDYFVGSASYPDVDYEDIPTVSLPNGKFYRLSDVVDMRPVKDQTGANFSGTGAIIENLPRNGAILTCTNVKYWEGRVDTIVITAEGQIKNFQGLTERPPVTARNIPKRDMLLHQIKLNPYVISKDDLRHVRFNNKGYKMTDIQGIERRVKNLETTTTLTLAEIDNLKTSIPDPNDATLPDRVKLGLTGDAFRNNLQSMVYDPDYRAKIRRDAGTLQPIKFQRQVPLHYDSDQSEHTVIKGSSIWPKYDEEVYITQDIASSYTQVNQFELSRSVGSGFMEPNLDTWQIRQEVDEAYQVQSEESFIPIGSKQMSSQGDNTG